MAWQLLRNQPVSGYWPPGLPYYLAFFHMLLGGGMLVARASILTTYIAFSASLYALLKMLSSRRAGNLAIAVFALYPSYIRYAFNPSTEYLSATCLLIIAYLTIRAVRYPSYRLAVPLGLALGALALVRANSIGLAIVIPIFLAMRTRSWRVAACTLLIPLALISAWLWKAHDLTGRFIPINDSNEENLVFSNHPDTPLYLTCRDCPIYGRLPPAFLKLEHEIDYKPSPERQRELQTTTIQFVLTRPDLFAIRTFNRFRAYFRFPIHYADPLVRHSGVAAAAHRWLAIAITIGEAAFYWPLMSLAIVSCFIFRSFSIRLDVRPILLSIAAIYALPCWFTWSEPRYAFPVIPLLAVFSFVLLASISNSGLRNALASVQASRWGRRAMFATLAFFFCTQLEWIVLIVCSNAMKDKWASISSFRW
ncbi:MAG TPA: glycosyltransferase family 39 protein [Bryobacteraceae bacterium]|jgi:4-amino-4-deoxy-L-arabinose transferase-like glycosyltransferase|nr:glycosyltransferase family 39 protein [Bryobacteraceae bacterium]